MSDNRRIIRVPLQPDLIRSVDALIAKGSGGYSTRAEFIADAVESLVLEMTFPHASEDSSATSSPIPEDDFPSTINNEDAATTALSRVTAVPMAEGEATVERGNLFGLHNRDYPSLWAAHFLGSHYDGPVALDRYLDDVTGAAWEFGRILDVLGERTNSRLTPIFPTNQQKPQSAIDGFRAFAIGEILSDPGRKTVRGPLFVWGVCQLERHGDEVRIGLTPVGMDLLEQIAGITALMPHEETFARTFLGHLEAHAPEDLWGFQVILEAVASGGNREDLIEKMNKLRPKWSKAQAETNAAGYISRCREWGAVDPRQQQRRYVITEFGQTLLNEWA